MIEGDEKDFEEIIPMPDHEKTYAGDEGATVATESVQRVQAIAPQIPKLEQIEGPGAPQVFTLTEASYVIGRSEQTDIPFDSRKLSRRHVELRKADGTYMFTDLESTNGVFLNSMKVHSSTLADGDMLSIGDVVFVYRKTSQ